MAAFEELGVMPAIIQALSEQNWVLPRPVQTEAIPLILGGGDVAVAAETGAGKTGAFCIPILQIVHETLNQPERPMAIDYSAPIALSSVDRSKDVAIDGAVAQSRNQAAWQGVRATRRVCRGKWYFRARPDDDGLSRFGWSSAQSSLNLGTDVRGFGFGGTGKKSHNGKFDDYGRKFSNGDVITSLLEFHAETGCASVGYLLNGDDLGMAFESVPLAKVGDGLRPACAMKNAQVVMAFNEIDARAESMGFRNISEATADDTAPPSSRVIEQDDAAEKYHGQGSGQNVSGDSDRVPLAIILEPSRELAEQVHGELQKISCMFEAESVKQSLLVGGGNPKKEAASLRAGIDIVSGTLGCIKRHVEKGALSLENIRFFVLDEADTFADDNLGDVRKLHEAIPPRNQVQTLLFSATLHSPGIRSLSENMQQFPTWIDLKGKEAVPETVHHTLLHLDSDVDHGLIGAFERCDGASLESPFPWPHDSVHCGNVEDAADVRSHTMKKIKLAALKRVIDANRMEHAMLFVRTQLDGDNLEKFLLLCSGVRSTECERRRFRGCRDSGPEIAYSCAVLHGGRRPEERRSALSAFRNGEVRFLICTDVAARGIDISGLPYLVNVTLPDKPENYIHRVGRVGRSDYMGMAVSLISSQKEAVWFHSCKNAKNGECKRRRLVDVGGCVLWYNESKILEEIESRLGGQIERLGEGFVRANGKNAAPVLYGAMRDHAEMSVATAAHVESLKPAVQELVRMEHDVQTSFFALLARYPLHGRGAKKIANATE